MVGKSNNDNDEESQPIFSSSYIDSYGSNTNTSAVEISTPPPPPQQQQSSDNDKSKSSPSLAKTIKIFCNAIPACALIALLNLMMAVPFGSAYFSSSITTLDETTKQTYGMRLSILASAVGQFVMGTIGTSAFHSLNVWQLGELAQFYHTFTDIAVNLSHETNDDGIVFPTTLYLISLSTLAVGMSFYLLGKFGLGQLTYFFPTHVLLGLIGGVGLWLGTLSTKVSISPSILSISMGGGDGSGSSESKDTNEMLISLHAAIQPHFVITIMFTIGLRILQFLFPKEKFQLLDPIYFLSIPGLFYVGMYLCNIQLDDAVNYGYFFANPTTGDGTNSTFTESTLSSSSSSVWIGAFDIWKEFDLTKVRYDSIFYAAPTILTCGLMGVMLNAPFIPAMAIFLGTEDTFDFNREFVSHGYSNILSSLIVPGGLGMAMCYSTGSLYKNAGGEGKLANTLVVILLLTAYIYGPQYVQYIPRCMAGSLLLDMGINLVLEAIIEPRNNCDVIEYTSIWIILITMNIFNMTTGLVAGMFLALLTYTLQSYIDKDPIRSICDASALPSSKWRNEACCNILNDPMKGRGAHIIVIQLQGHLFFGNMSKVQDTILNYIEKEKGKRSGSQQSNDKGDIMFAIEDFTLVTAIDATGASFLQKMNDRITKQYDIETILVSGPVKIKPGEEEQEEATSMRQESPSRSSRSRHRTKTRHSLAHNQTAPSEAFDMNRRSSVGSSNTGRSHKSGRNHSQKRARAKRRTTMTIRGPYEEQLEKQTSIDGTFYETLDEALIICEDRIVAKHDPQLSMSMLSISNKPTIYEGEEEEMKALVNILDERLVEADSKIFTEIIKHFERETYGPGDIIWHSGDKPSSAKLLFEGKLFILGKSTEDRSATGDGNNDEDEEDLLSTKRSKRHPRVDRGDFIGLRSLILNDFHLSTIQCETNCIFYTLSQDSYNNLVEKKPKFARVLDLFLLRKLSRQIQSVSNNICVDNRRAICL